MAANAVGSGDGAGMPPGMADVHQIRRAAAAAAAVVLLALLLAALGLGGGEEDPAAGAAAAEGASAPAEAAPAELPGGGRRIFPEHRVVAFYGHPDDEQLGVLGIGSPQQAAKRLRRQARAYERPDRPVLPAMELLASVATYDAGPDGLYRRRTKDAVIRRYLRAARSMDALLILDIQPGRAAFLPEARALRRWLREPDVSLALDPEWKVSGADVPGDVIGEVDAAEVNAVAEWLDALTERERLPQKLLVVHQFTEDMIVRKELLRPRRNLAVVLNADGFGSAELKAAKYRDFTGGVPWSFDGFKLFYEEDTDLMTPREVLRLRPSPDVVVYE